MKARKKKKATSERVNVRLPLPNSPDSILPSLSSAVNNLMADPPPPPSPCLYHYLTSIPSKHKRETTIMAAENGIESSPAVTVSGKKSVAPAKNRCTLLATFDLPYITFYYNQKLLLYRAPDDGRFPDAVARMTAALAEALRVFYPLAGRIRQEADGALVVEGDEGAEVVEAEAQGVSVDDLAGGGACGEESERIMQDLVPYTGVMNLEGLRRPLLAVQVVFDLSLASLFLN
jgi:hypothetical protein